MAGRAHHLIGPYPQPQCRGTPARGSHAPRVVVVAGDAVIVHDDDSLYSRKWLDEMSALFPFLSHVSIVSATDTGKPGAPWGWSGDAARRLSRAGAECPSIAQLERMRMLSHRCTSLMVMEYLKQNSTIPLPSYLPRQRQLKKCNSPSHLRLMDSTSNRHGQAAGAE